MGWRLMLWGLVAVVLTGVQSVEAENGYVVKQLTNNSWMNEDLQINNNGWAVWRGDDRDASTKRIYLYKGRGITQKSQVESSRKKTGLEEDTTK